MSIAKQRQINRIQKGQNDIKNDLQPHQQIQRRAATVNTNCSNSGFITMYTARVNPHENVFYLLKF